MARERRRQAVDHEHAEPGQSTDGRQESDPWPRCLGARLLPEVPEQTARLHQCVVERRQLGRGAETVRFIVWHSLVPSASTILKRAAQSAKPGARELFGGESRRKGLTRSGGDL